MYQAMALVLSGMLAFSASACAGKMPVQEKEEAAAAETIIQAEDTETASIRITADGRTFTATLYENETAMAFAERLPLTASMQELNGNEKYVYLDESLPATASNPGRIQTGDIMLYGSECLVLFYEDFPTSYSYTPIGRVTDTEGLAEALGKGSASVAFAPEE